MKIRIEEENDGFAIVLTAYSDHDLIAIQGKEKRWRFDQEDSVEALGEVFLALGHTAVQYEEVY